MTRIIFILACVIGSFVCVYSVPLSESQLLPSFNDLENEIKAKITPTVFALQGVETCGGGVGYCVFGNTCADVDPEFHDDENDGHCIEVAYKVTPYAQFVCCKHIPIPFTEYNTSLTWGDQGNGTWNLPPLLDGPLDLAPTQLEEIDDSNMVTMVINGHTFIFSSETYGTINDPMELFQIFTESLDHNDDNNTVEIIRETVQHYHNTDNQKIDSVEDNTLYADSLTSEEKETVIDNDKFTFDGLPVGSFRLRRKPLKIEMPPIPMMPEFLMEEIRKERQVQLR
ncbi:uncharacterized protein LOC136038648 [Artemia franciscana]|uniref:uncharacterized protein LOC136038648 n=1 Tax=Artemia franciscana TaxID=6661 RepID=UPI0032DB1693